MTAEPEPPRVTVIIPVFNDAERLRACLDALALQDLGEGRFSAIVVDNGSADPPQGLVESYPFCRFLVEVKPGSYAARNTAIASVTDGVIAFTDSDCLPTPGWISSGIAALLADEQTGLAGGKIEVFPKDPERPNPVELYDCVFGLNQRLNVQKHRHAATANAFTHRAVFDKVGFFNDSLRSGGDLEWGQRVAAAGYKVVFAEEAVIRHPARPTLRALKTQAKRHAGGAFDRRRRSRWRFASPKFWKNAARAVVPNVDRILRARAALKQRGYGTRAWLGVSCVVLQVQYAQAVEFARKVLGSESERN